MKSNEKKKKTRHTRHTGSRLKHSIETEAEGKLGYALLIGVTNVNEIILSPRAR